MTRGKIKMHEMTLEMSFEVTCYSYTILEITFVELEGNSLWVCHYEQPLRASMTEGTNHKHKYKFWPV